MVITNWFQQHDVQNTILIPFGMIISTNIGGLFTAHIIIIDADSDEALIDIRHTNPFKASFYPNIFASVVWSQSRPILNLSPFT